MGGEDAEHAGMTPGTGHVETHQSRVGVGRADDVGVGETAHDEIVRVLGLTTDESRVLQPLDLAADEAGSGRHANPPDDAAVVMVDDGRQREKWRSVSVQSGGDLPRRRVRTVKSVTPFTLAVPESALADLRERLGRVRWPDEIPGGAWSYGTDLAYMKSLVGYWREQYDWRAHEAALNRFQQFIAPVAGIDVHFLHEPGVGPRPLPLLLAHGWPGSVWEFHRIIPMLTDPGRHGGDPADAFTVVAPSLPGYGFSFTPNQPRFGIVEIAEALAGLMTDVLGYARFGAQGGDWGSFVASRLGF